MLTPEDLQRVVERISQDRKLCAQLWKAMLDDPANVRVLAEALHEFVRDGGRLPK